MGELYIRSREADSHDFFLAPVTHSQYTKCVIKPLLET
jgi:hypothetical protein